jgi:hypothetical protein
MTTDIQPKSTETATGYALSPALPTVKKYGTHHTAGAAFPIILRAFIDAAKWT